jgi:hypothetical protein
MNGKENWNKVSDDKSAIYALLKFELKQNPCVCVTPGIESDSPENTAVEISNPTDRLY